MRRMTKVAFRYRGRTRLWTGRRVFMIKIRPPTELTELLDLFDARGGAIDFDFYDVGVIAPDMALHREAAGSLLSDAADAHAGCDKSLDREPIWKSHNNYVWDESRLVGKPVSFAEFWGSDLPESGFRIPDGFKTAFFLTPYGLSGSIAGNQQLFDDICQRLFPEHLRDVLAIYTWHAEGCTAFDARDAWWGIFFWTVSWPDDNFVCVITASATD